MRRILLLEGFFTPDELPEIAARRLAVVVHSEDQVRMLELARLERLTVVESFAIEAPKTKMLAEKLKQLGLAHGSMYPAGSDKGETKDNDGEVQAVRTTNQRVTLRFAAKPIGTTIALAQAILADAPAPGSVVTFPLSC